MKRIICMLLVASFVLLYVTTATAMSIDTVVPITHYTYPINSDSENWTEYTVHEKVEMLRIPESTLSQMTDEALVTAIAEYPYLCDIGLYGTVEESIEVCRSYFSALDELLSRPTATNALTTYGLAVANTSVALWNDSEVSTAELFPAFAITELINTICSDIQVEVTFEATTDNASISIRSVPMTPAGTAVPFDTEIEEHSTQYHASLDAYTVENYNVTLVRSGSCVYNCHSYAWHDRSRSNGYWIGNPSAYMDDGSYICTYSGNTSPAIVNSGIGRGNIIYYNGGTHSAVFDANTATGNSIATGSCVSKWGIAGVFRHNLTNVPDEYDCSRITAWCLAD